jgi:hypothetical protein
MVKKIPATAILNLNNPDIGIKTDLARQVGFNFSFWHDFSGKTWREGPFNGALIIECTLGRRAEQFGCPIQPVYYHKNRTGLLCPAPAHNGIGTLGLTAAHIGGNPNA